MQQHCYRWKQWCEWSQYQWAQHHNLHLLPTLFSLLTMGKAAALGDTWHGHSSQTFTWCPYVVDKSTTLPTFQQLHIWVLNPCKCSRCCCTDVKTVTCIVFVREIECFEEFLASATNASLVSGTLAVVKKNGPGWSPHSTTYSRLRLPQLGTGRVPSIPE